MTVLTNQGPLYGGMGPGGHPSASHRGSEPAERLSEGNGFLIVLPRAFAMTSSASTARLRPREEIPVDSKVIRPSPAL